MASSVGGQGKPGLLAVSRKKNLPESHKINPLLIRSLFGQDCWILAAFFFLRDYGPSDKHVKIELHWLLSSHLDLALAQ